MKTFICKVCGQQHTELLMDLAYQRPADVFKIPVEERPERIRMNDDLCIIDDREFYIRGVLALPVSELDDSFRWGVWAQVDQESFDYYQAHWHISSVAGLMPFSGRLSGGLAAYSESDQLRVSIHLQPNNQRPLFVVEDQDHPLNQAQQQGITLHDVEAFVARIAPHPAT